MARAANIVMPGRKLFANKWSWTVSALVMVCLVAGCGKTDSRSIKQELVNQEDEEIRLEAQVERLLGAVNTQHRELAAIISTASTTLTPELREKAKAERHKSYSEKDFIDTLEATREMAENKISGLAAEKATFQNPDNPDNGVTNLVMTSLQATNGVMDERMAEANLKMRLVEVRVETEELTKFMPSAARLPAEDRQKALSARDEYYSSERYLSQLRATKSLLEKKLTGLEAEVVFYRGRASLASANGGTND